MDNFLIAKATDVGMVRQVNEDSITVFDSPNGQVMAVCDGMGGQAAGDVASQLAVSIIESILTDNTFETPAEAIRRSVLAANQGVLNRAAQNPELEGMGSTCVMLVIKDGQVHCGWVGDSRIYYISNHTIRQISHDQSYVQKLVDQGAITQTEAQVHPQKNEIENCIGLPGMTAPETIAVPITPEPGSVFLLCSDGLTGMVADAQIERIVSNPRMTLQQKADRLVQMANENGGLDNITIGLVQFGTPGSEGATSGTMFDGPRTTKKKNNTWLYCVIALICAVIIGVAAYFILSGSEQPEQKPAKTEQSTSKAPTGGAEKKVEEKKETETKMTNNPPKAPADNPKSESNKKKKDPVREKANKVKGDGNTVNDAKNLVNTDKDKNVKDEIENFDPKKEEKF